MLNDSRRTTWLSLYVNSTGDKIMVGVFYVDRERSEKVQGLFKWTKGKESTVNR
jgi:hypothetical protein